MTPSFRRKRKPVRMRINYEKMRALVMSALIFAFSFGGAGSPRRIVVAYRLGALGSADSLLAVRRAVSSHSGDSLRKNDTQSFCLAHRLEPPHLFGATDSNPRLAPQKERKRNPQGIPFSLSRVDKKDAKVYFYI